ncbi:general transcription factor 3C polypeptide 6-like [Clytia hemisphaerica]|uniref:general transcription factor 3C polypeptide 6-like n=1 Tax=Clytia hemisphaerica TaxID=252671 RepID=UPI0034D414B4
MSQEEEEKEWVEQLVAVELVGMIDPDKLNMIDKSNSAILGISSDESTILKLGGYAFSGKNEDAIGSIVAFEDVSDEGEEPKLKYVGHTTKVIKANRIFLKEKKKENSEEGDVNGQDQENDENEE